MGKGAAVGSHLCTALPMSWSDRRAQQHNAALGVETAGNDPFFARALMIMPMSAGVR